MGTFIFFIPLGFTINTLTMFGFVLAIGIVVDDAIIVVEAVQHYIDEQHMSPKEATYHRDEGDLGTGNSYSAHIGLGVRAGRLYTRYSGAFISNLLLL
jgi:hypothetical protein